MRKLMMWVLFPVLVAAGAALAASGHASDAEPQWLAQPVVFLHVAAVAVWAGALAPLGLELARRSGEGEIALRRFSRAIPGVVLLLVAGGLVLAVIQLERPAALIDTAYGREPIPAMREIAKQWGFKLIEIAIPPPGL